MLLLSMHCKRFRPRLVNRNRAGYATMRKQRPPFLQACQNGLLQRPHLCKLEHLCCSLRCRRNCKRHSRQRGCGRKGHLQIQVAC